MNREKLKDKLDDILREQCGIEDPTDRMKDALVDFALSLQPPQVTRIDWDAVWDNFAKTFGSDMLPSQGLIEWLENNIKPTPTGEKEGGK